MWAEQGANCSSGDKLSANDSTTCDSQREAGSEHRRAAQLRSRAAREEEAMLLAHHGNYGTSFFILRRPH
jgi:hypothetical protein